jgi:hypothetical protein
MEWAQTQLPTVCTKLGGSDLSFIRVVTQTNMSDSHLGGARFESRITTLSRLRWHFLSALAGHRV